MFQNENNKPEFVIKIQNDQNATQIIALTNTTQIVVATVGLLVGGALYIAYYKIMDTLQKKDTHNEKKEVSLKQILNQINTLFPFVWNQKIESLEETAKNAKNTLNLASQQMILEENQLKKTKKEKKAEYKVLLKNRLEAKDLTDEEKKVNAKIEADKKTEIAIVSKKLNNIEDNLDSISVYHDMIDTTKISDTEKKHLWLTFAEIAANFFAPTEYNKENVYDYIINIKYLMNKNNNSDLSKIIENEGDQYKKNITLTENEKTEYDASYAEHKRNKNSRKEEINARKKLVLDVQKIKKRAAKQVELTFTAANLNPKLNP